MPSLPTTAPARSALQPTAADRPSWLAATTATTRYGGFDLLARPVTDDDAPLAHRFYAALSDRSRWLRWGSARPTLTPQMTANLLGHGTRRAGAFVVLAAPRGDDPTRDGIPVGWAQWFELPADTSGATVELAVAVADEFHRAGVGTVALSAAVAAARSEAGARRFIAEVAAENRGVQALLSSLFADVVTVADAGSHRTLCGSRPLV